NGGMGRRHLVTGEGGFFRPSAGRGRSTRFGWNTPFLLSAHNPSIQYSAGNHVFRSLRRGDAPRRVSPEISRTDRGAATALAESPRDAETLYVGTDDGALWRTLDGGVVWQDLFALHEEGEGLLRTDAPLPEEAEAAAAAPSDPVSGTWALVAKGAGIEGEEQGAVALELALGAEGAVSGSLESAGIGAGAIEG
ncbi:MAG: hypothetical protein KDC48_23990, partial [Planctomycetes bacterium]|nr:hypothetical protein [Planctomycetota bacterium]